jgi:outer membrane autotransporter protein
VDGIVGASWNEYSSKRTISAVSLQANANYSGQNYVAKIRTGVNQNLGGGFTLSPNASLNYIRNNIGNYNETGADTLSLQVKGSSTNFFEARVGTILSCETISAKGTKITPKISASYGYNFLSSAQTISGNFVGQSVTFNTISAKLDPRSLKLGTGIDLYNLDSITISADYNMERKQKYQSHSGVLKFRYSF